MKRLKKTPTKSIMKALRKSIFDKLIEAVESGFKAEVEDNNDNEIVVSYGNGDYGVDIAIAKDGIDVKTSYYSGDYDSGDYYDRGYSIDSVDIDPRCVEVEAYLAGDGDVSKEEFLATTKMPEEELARFVKEAKAAATSKAESWIYDNPEDWISE